MTQDNIVKLSPPGTFSDPLTEVLRNGARALLAHAVEAEVAGFLGGHADKLTDDGHRRLVRHGHLPEREIMTGIGAVAVRCPRVRDRAADGGERIRFSSAILPPYARRSKSLEVLIPILYLKGISTGDFEEALAALLGKDPSCGLLCIARWSSLKLQISWARIRHLAVWVSVFPSVPIQRAQSRPELPAEPSVAPRPSQFRCSTPRTFMRASSTIFSPPS